MFVYLSIFVSWFFFINFHSWELMVLATCATTKVSVQTIPHKICVKAVFHCWTIQLFLLISAVYAIDYLSGNRLYEKKAGNVMNYQAVNWLKSSSYTWKTHEIIIRISELWFSSFSSISLTLPWITKITGFRISSQRFALMMAGWWVADGTTAMAGSALPLCLAHIHPDTTTKVECVQSLCTVVNNTLVRIVHCIMISCCESPTALKHLQFWSRLITGSFPIDWLLASINHDI